MLPNLNCSIIMLAVLWKYTCGTMILWCSISSSYNTSSLHESVSELLFPTWPTITSKTENICHCLVSLLGIPHFRYRSVFSHGGGVYVCANLHTPSPFRLCEKLPSNLGTPTFFYYVTAHRDIPSHHDIPSRHVVSRMDFRMKYIDVRFCAKLQTPTPDFAQIWAPP